MGGARGSSDRQRDGGGVAVPSDRRSLMHCRPQVVCASSTQRPSHVLLQQYGSAAQTWVTHGSQLFSSGVPWLHRLCVHTAHDRPQPSAASWTQRLSHSTSQQNGSAA